MWNLQFADDIDLMESSNGELQDLTVDRATGCRKEVSADKSKIMTNSTTNTSVDISMNRRKLGGMTSFKYPGATLCKNGTCVAEVRIRIASAMTAMARVVKSIWRRNTISITS